MTMDFSDKDDIWHHDVKATISRIRSKANGIGLVFTGHYTLHKLPTYEKDLWEIAGVLDSQVKEMFDEIKRLQKKCGERT